MKVLETEHGWYIKCRCSHHYHIFPKKKMKESKYTIQGTRQDDPNATWFYNGDTNNPTFDPSLVNWYNRPNRSDGNKYDPNKPSFECHIVVTNGEVDFKNDCTHEFKGQKLPLEDWTEAEIAMWKDE